MFGLLYFYEMKRVLIVLFAISFLCNGCSYSYFLYIRNFYKVPIVFNLEDLDDLVPMHSERIEVAHKIVRINSNTYKQFTDSIVFAGKRDFEIILPPHSTNKIGKGSIGASLHPYSNRKNFYIKFRIGDSVKAIKLENIKKKNRHQYYLDIEP